MMNDRNCLLGVYTYGSPCNNTFDAKGPDSALAQVVKAGYSSAVITDVSIANRAVNEAFAKAYGMDIRQGVIIRAIPFDGKKPYLFTLFPAALPEISERLLAEWSMRYSQGSLEPMKLLPFGTSEVVTQVMQVPFDELMENKDVFLIFNCTLEADTAIPYYEECLDLYNGFFIDFSGRHKVYPEQIRNLKRICKKARWFLPHFGIGSMMSGQRDLKCLRDIIDNRTFPVPDSMELVSMTEFRELYGLMTSGEEFFLDTPRIEVTSALIPGAKLLAEFQAVEVIPEKLRPTEEQRREQVSEIKRICMEKLQATYEGENLEFGMEVLSDELELLYARNYMYGQALLMLHNVLSSLDKECVILFKFFTDCPLIFNLLGLSRYNPILEDAEGGVICDVIDMNTITLETSEATYRLILDKFQEMYPGRMAEVAREMTMEEYLETNENARVMMKAATDLSYEEKENLRKAVVAFRPSTNNHHNILWVPEEVALPGIRIEGTDMPLVTPSFSYLAQVLAINISFAISETIARFERVEDAVIKKYDLKITKTVEKRVFEEFLPELDRVMSAGVRELGPLIRRKIRQAKPTSRYALATIFSKCFLDGDCYMGFKYHLQLVDIIIAMLVASLSHPEDYFEAVDDHQHDLEWYDEDVLERMVYEPVVDGKIDEKTEALLIENKIPTEHFLRESANFDRPLIEYAKRKRFYPKLLL